MVCPDKPVIRISLALALALYRPCTTGSSLLTFLGGGYVCMKEAVNLISLILYIY